MSEYNELVEKLAGEIVAEVAESIEKEAGFKDKAGKAGKAIKGFMGGDLKAALEARKYQAGRGHWNDALKKSNEATTKKNIAIGAGKAAVAPVVAGGGIAAAMMAKKKKEAAAEKAASILFEAQLQKVAAEEAYSEAQLGEDAAVAILNELGISPEDVLNAMIEAEDAE